MGCLSSARFALTLHSFPSFFFNAAPPQSAGGELCFRALHGGELDTGPSLRAGQQVDGTFLKKFIGFCFWFL